MSCENVTILSAVELLNFTIVLKAGAFFESYFMDYTTTKDQWTASSSLLLAATTVIPVGYGFIVPATRFGRIFLIVYSLIGTPLVLFTITDLGKFLSNYMFQVFTGPISNVLILLSMCAYLVLAALYFTLATELSFLDSLYFSIISVFTIGFGDMNPTVSVFSIIIFLTLGVLLVTITVENVGANAIHRIHYMGRYVGKVKQFADKMYQIAQFLSAKRSGLFSNSDESQVFDEMINESRIISEFLKRTYQIQHSMDNSEIPFSPASAGDIQFVDMAI